MAGRKAKPTAIRRLEGNRGKRAWNHAEPVPPDARPRCPEHLGAVARKEWRRLAHALYEMGVLTVVDRAALAAYCAAYGRWVEAEERLQETPALIRTPSGHVQQSPWMGVANRQLEIMGRYMAELGLTPAARSRVAAGAGPIPAEPLHAVLSGPSAATLADAETFMERIALLSRRTVALDAGAPGPETLP